MFVNRTGSPSLYSGQAAGVPGELRGLEALHGKFGTLPWKSLFQPAIHYARNGFTVNEDLAKVIVGLDYLKDDPAWAKDFAPNGTLVQKGQKMFRKRYADTLEKISKKGANAFYEGEIAEKLVETLKAKTGIITLEDLKGYKVAEREPLSIEYRGHKITAGSAPSSGTVVLSALKIFGNFEITGDKGVDYHRLIEATKFGYGQVLTLSSLLTIKSMLTLPLSTSVPTSVTPASSPTSPTTNTPSSSPPSPPLSPAKSSPTPSSPTSAYTTTPRASNPSRPPAHPTL